MSDQAPQSSLNILFVDDEPSMRKMMTSFLKVLGHTVVLANDGLEALQVFQEGGCNFVITDYAMPHLGGDALATAIKKRSPGTPVLLITGFETRVSSTAVDHRLQKPFTSGDLARAIADTQAASAKA